MNPLRCGVAAAALAATHSTMTASNRTGESYTQEQFQRLLQNGHCFRGPVTVTGHLELYDFDLGLLPADLTVQGYCYFFRAKNKELPPRLSVTHTFCLMDAPEITSIPEDLVVGGDVEFHRCPSLCALPSWIYSLGFDSNGSHRCLRIGGTAIPAAELEKLANAAQNGVVLHICASKM